jgi:hypothetical protein
MMGTLSNYRLDGYSNFILDFVYQNDLATTKSDALRIAIRKLAEAVGAPSESEYLQRISEERKAKELEEDYRKGRAEAVPAKEYLAKHPELRKYIKG